MRERLFHTAGFAIILLGLAVNVYPATGSRWTVINEPTRLVNGNPVLFRVTMPKPVRVLTGTWLGHEITFSFDASTKTWFALAGVGQETKPGTYPLELHAESSSGRTAGQPPALSFEKKIRVERQRYPRVLLKVPGRYTAPSPEDKREI